jgi:hypothetical protein
VRPARHHVLEEGEGVAAESTPLEGIPVEVQMAGAYPGAGAGRILLEVGVAGVTQVRAADRGKGNVCWEWRTRAEGASKGRLVVVEEEEGGRRNAGQVVGGTGGVVEGVVVEDERDGANRDLIVEDGGSPLVGGYCVAYR